MSTPPLVTIVINNFNYAHFLGEAIESALAQTYSPLEVVVVDDGSTDTSRQIIERCGSRVTPVFKHNGGQGSAYNAGVEVSHGDAICFLDADDTLFPSAIAEAMTLLDPDASKVQWPLVVTDAQGRSTGKLSTTQKPPTGDLRARIAADGPLYDFEFHTGSLYARRFLDCVIPVPELPYRNGADVYFIVLAPAYGLIRTASTALGTYRAHGSNNYRGRQLDDSRIENYLARFETNADVLARALQSLGISAEPAAWRTRNFNYVWLARLKRSKRHLTQIAPLGSTIILVDGAEWGAGEHVPGRRLRPFLERGGEYYGPPESDAIAINELTRMRHEGADFIAFWWTELWWLEQYPQFANHLAVRSRRVLAEDYLTVFDLRDQPQ